MDAVREAVANALRKSGTDILHDEDRFLESVCAAIGHGTTEEKLLRVGCDDIYLKAFSTAVEEGTRESLEAASIQAAEYLKEAYVLNPEVASRVSSGIAEGCADILGVELQPSVLATQKASADESAKTHPVSIALKALALIIVAVVVTLVYAHFEPVFGSTLFPTKSTVGGIDFERYVVRGPSGEKNSVFLVDNFGNDRMLLTPRSGIKALTTSPRLLKDNQGVIITDADAKPDDFVIQSFPTSEHVPSGLSWSIQSHEDEPLLCIDCKERHKLSIARKGALILVVRGPLLRYCAIPTEVESIDYGLTTFALEASDGDKGPSPLELASDPDCELFFLGRKIPRSES